EVSAYGVPMLVDPGFYTYNGAEKWHRYFRETKAHNTVVVDGCSQAEYRGRLKWSRAPDVRLEHCMLSRAFDYVEASHNGYRRLAQPVVHRRAVVFLKPDYWLIRDELWGEGEHQIDLYFHFTAEVSCQRDETVVLARSPSGGNLAVFSLEKKDIALESKLDGNEPEDGWLAMSYGKKMQAPVVRYSTKAILPIALNTLLVPFRSDMPDIIVDAIQLAKSSAASDQGFIVSMGSKKDILVFSSSNHDSPVEFHGKGWLTNGRLSCLRLDTQGEIVSCALVAGSILVGAGEGLLQIGHKVPFAALDFENGRAIVEKAKATDGLTSSY
ncbi:MAG TPA: heparinase II/III-family protein, partial [Candidatus Binatia bacterium]|nr:heparinase II/III-family protein [Candidatus Binatia bacterium]